MTEIVDRVITLHADVMQLGQGPNLTYWQMSPGGDVGHTNRPDPALDVDGLPMGVRYDTTAGGWNEYADVWAEGIGDSFRLARV